MKAKYGIPLKELQPNDPPRPVRTSAGWEKKRLDRERRRLFTPRLQKDLIELRHPTDFPDIRLWTGEGLFLYGPAKIGKTVFSAQLLLDVQKQLWINYQSKDVLFTSVPELFSQLKKSFNSSELDEHQILEQQQQVWLLVLDDLGVSGKPSEWLLEILYLIINYRYEHLLPTIITSNLSLKQLSELYGDVRITSRIERMCRIVKKKPYE